MGKHLNRIIEDRIFSIKCELEGIEESISSKERSLKLLGIRREQLNEELKELEANLVLE